MTIWEELHGGFRASKGIGMFGNGRFVTSIGLPKHMKNKTFTVEHSGNIIRVRLNPKALRKVGSSLGVQVNMKECIKEKQVVFYVDEESFYMAPYSLGSEYLKKFLKSEGVL